MSTVEDFENAPVGATAIHPLGSRAMRVDAVAPSWIAQNVVYLDDGEMVHEGYALEPLAPTAAREALDLAWVLAHEVKPGQVIPEGARYLRLRDGEINAYTAIHNVKIRSSHATVTRTLDPLPDPEPDWIDAPAVIAVHDSYTKPSIWSKHWDQERLAEYYQSALTAGSAHWSELRDVTPLYPKEGQNA